MKLHTLSILAAAGTLALAFGTLPNPAAASAHVSQITLSEVNSARSELTKGHVDAAIEHTERAETTLLNAKQAGDETAPKAYDALKNAHEGLMSKDRKSAMSALDEAASELRGATS